MNKVGICAVPQLSTAAAGSYNAWYVLYVRYCTHVAWLSNLYTLLLYLGLRHVQNTVRRIVGKYCTCVGVLVGEQVSGRPAVA